MNRGEVWWVSFGPSVGGEIQKNRPAVIISSDASNKSLNRVQVVPLTSNVTRVYPCEALVTVKGETRKAMADQIATVSKLRLTKQWGKVGPEGMAAIERAICVQLGL